MKDEMILADVAVTFYKVVSDEYKDRDKRFRRMEDAIAEAKRSDGKVIKVIKRMRETIEFEPLSLMAIH